MPSKESDPLLKEAHDNLFNSYLEIQKIYRDQHSLIQQADVHSVSITGLKLKGFLYVATKVGLVMLVGILQVMLVKFIIDDKEKITKRLDGEEEAPLKGR